MRKNKGLEYLIKAEPHLRKKIKNIKIIIAGENPYFEYDESMLSSPHYEIANQFIPNQDIPQYFRRASLVVLPYISATQSGIIPLAFAFGKPVVATSVGAIPEIVENGKTGLLVEPKNEIALAEAICKVLLNPNLLKKMSKNALRYCDDELSWDAIAQKTIKIYEELNSKYN